MPTWSPAPPAFVEAKRPGKDERALQAAVRDNWRARGCDVRDRVSTPEEVDALCDRLLVEAVQRYIDISVDAGRYTPMAALPAHIIKAYHIAISELSCL